MMMPRFTGEARSENNADEALAIAHGGSDKIEPDEEEVACFDSSRPEYDSSSRLWLACTAPP